MNMEFSLLTQTRRYAFFVQPEIMSEDGQFIPCIAVEGVPGYFQTDWLWGKDKTVAEKCAKERNERLGIDEKTAFQIILSTMKQVPVH